MKVFAHRGFSHRFPEGTRAAYQGAIDAGADGFECDVRLTRDKEIICFHDRTLERITGKRKAVSRISAPDLAQLTEFITLQELLDMAITYRKDLLIETKHPVMYAGEIEERVVELLKNRAPEIAAANINISIMSFSYCATLRLKKRFADVIKVIK